VLKELKVHKVLKVLIQVHKVVWELKEPKVHKVLREAFKELKEILVLK
jgi:hypothetical protein